MHQTVLLYEAVDALVTSPDGFYVDGTFGRGGHSRYLLQRLNASGIEASIAHNLVLAGLALRARDRPPATER